MEPKTDPVAWNLIGNMPVCGLESKARPRAQKGQRALLPLSERLEPFCDSTHEMHKIQATTAGAYYIISIDRYMLYNFLCSLALGIASITMEIGTDRVNARRPEKLGKSLRTK